MEVDLNQSLSKALSGKAAHLSARRATDGLSIEVSGKAIDNVPYTIWQLLRHINYWQANFVRRLNGESFKEDESSTLGWDFPVNADNQEQLDNEVKWLLNSIADVKTRLASDEQFNIVPNENYKSYHDVVQAMASHLSYHLGELVVMRKVFSNWPPKGGGYEW
ncbi:MAG: DinB family protein [Cyclobacteriaceae bacterium]